MVKKKTFNILLLALVSLPVVFTTSCYVNNSYIPMTAHIQTYVNGELCSPDTEIIVRFDDSAPHSKQTKLTFKAVCTSESVKYFAFDKINTSKYPFILKGNDVITGNTVSTTISFNTDAGMRNWDNMQFQFGGHIEGFNYSCSNRINFAPHASFNTIEDTSIAESDAQMIGLYKERINASKFNYSSLMINEYWASIAPHAFDPLHVETNPTIADSVTHILPSTVKNIVPNFSNEDQLSLSRISEFAFQNNNISNVIIPSTVDTLGIKSFYNCSLYNLKLSKIQHILPLAFAKNDFLFNVNSPNDFSAVDFDTEYNHNFNTNTNLKWITQYDNLKRPIGKILIDDTKFGEGGMKYDENFSVYPLNIQNAIFWPIGSLAFGKLTIGGNTGENTIFPNFTSLETGKKQQNGKIYSFDNNFVNNSDKTKIRYEITGPDTLVSGPYYFVKSPSGDLLGEDEDKFKLDFVNGKCEKEFDAYELPDGNGFKVKDSTTGTTETVNIKANWINNNYFGQFQDATNITELEFNAKDLTNMIDVTPVEPINTLENTDNKVGFFSMALVGCKNLKKLTIHGGDSYTPPLPLYKTSFLPKGWLTGTSDDLVIYFDNEGIADKYRTNNPEWSEPFGSKIFATPTV